MSAGCPPPVSRSADAVAGSGPLASGQADRCLLVVDDDLSVRQALWIIFRERYAVRLAESGPKALELFREQPPDVVLLDIRMPGMDGLAVLKALKAADPDVEVILLSGFETVHYLREAMRLGASEYITKPYVVEDLRHSVENAMGRREASRKTAAYARRLRQLEELVQHQQVREELARTRNEIYGSIIHDINGPLTVMAGYIELMQLSIQHAEALESDQIKVLRQQTEAVGRQVANCIDLSRRYLGFLEGQMARQAGASINEVFYDLAELLKGHPQVRADRLVVRPFEGDLTPAIHRTDLLQILLNLTVNALQAGSENVRIELEARLCEPGAAAVFSQAAPGVHFLPSEQFDPMDKILAISVRDNGPGIAPHLLSRIFEPYFTTKPFGRSAGLGLSIVRRLVTHARGAVHVYSHQGEGTVFTVCVPVDQLPQIRQP